MKKIIMLIAFTAAIASWLSIIPHAVAQSYLPVTAFKAVSSNMFSTIACDGVLETAVKQDVCLGCPVKISKCYIQIGDYVKKGERLFDIDKNATLESLEVSGIVSIKQNSPSSSSSTSITSSDASSALGEALNSGIIGQSTYDSLLSQVQSANSTSSQISSDQSNSPQVLDYADAQKMVDGIEASLVAPISGIVTDMTDTSDGFSQSEESLAEISDPNSMEVKLNVEEDQITKIKIGQNVAITGTGFNGSYTGKVKEIYPTANIVNTDSGTKNVINVIVSIDKPNNNLIPGMTANAIVETSEQQGIVVAPYESIREDDNGTEYVFVFKNGVAVKKNIITGEDDNSGEEVLSGIKAGDILITNPPDSLTDGSNVRIEAE